MKITSPNQPPVQCDVAIVGAGPAGLAAATKLKILGDYSVVVLERESQAGGIPRHCGHTPFGMREFKRWMTGPAYAKAMVVRAEKTGVKIYTNTTVVKVNSGGTLMATSPNGVMEIRAKKIVLCTGVRETPRAPRLISGQRPLGILTTGALQSMVYLKNKIPCKRPVIIGSELVSFSTLLTCRHANIKPVAMVEENGRITAPSYSQILPKILGVKLYIYTQVIEILGKERVTGVRVRDGKQNERILKCDGVVFTGKFTPESTLLRMGHLDVDRASSGPVIDQYGRCSDPDYFATGNLLRSVETAGWCWKEGVQTARCVHLSLSDQLPVLTESISVMTKASKIKYVLPQLINLPLNHEGMKHFQLRFNTETNGKLSVFSGTKTLWSKKINVLPERRFLIPVNQQLQIQTQADMEIKLN